MLAWDVGTRHAFRVNVGKAGKWLQCYLTAEEWQMLMATYAGTDSDGMWASVLVMAKLFSRAARRVGDAFGFAYADEERVLHLIERIRRTPPGASDLA